MPGDSPELSDEPLETNSPPSGVASHLAHDDLPPSTQPVGQVWLKPQKARPFFGRHPWVLDSAVGRVEGNPAPGDVVDLVTDKGKFVARGLFNPHSRLRVRLYTWQVHESLDDDFWRGRLARAISGRASLGFDDPRGAARLVFSEADGLSGLVVDRYADFLAVQITGLGMARRRAQWLPMLSELTRARGILLRHEKGTSQAEGIDAEEGLCWGQAPDGPVFIEEHGLRYGVDLSEGQKTGFYLDQRDNRRVAANYFRGRRVLDLCCYSGGFSLCAMRWGQAREVLAVDASAKAVALVRANAELNRVAQIHTETADCFQALDDLAESRQRFGAVVLDPPKFARSRQAVNDALRAYHRLNRRAVDILEPGGVLVTCSCSGHVSREDFLYTLAGVAQQTSREIQVLEQRGAAADHPVSATCLESEYLKCFICRVA